MGRKLSGVSKPIIASTELCWTIADSYRSSFRTIRDQGRGWWEAALPRCSLNFLVCLLRESDRSLGHVKTPLTYKAMAEVLWDEDDRKIDGASQMGCRGIEVHPTLTATGATRKTSKNPTTHPNLMFHYRGFGCLGGVFAAGGCCNLLQTVAGGGCRRKMLQTVTSCCNLLQNAKICRFGVLIGSPRFHSRWGRTQYRWTRIHRRIAEKRGRT